MKVNVDLDRSNYRDLKMLDQVTGVAETVVENVISEKIIRNCIPYLIYLTPGALIKIFNFHDGR